MQALLSDPGLSDQAPAIAHRGAHDLRRIVDDVDDDPAMALPSQISQRNAVTIVGLESPRPELGTTSAFLAFLAAFFAALAFFLAALFACFVSCSPLVVLA
jgi:hypothetical protein